MALRAIEKAKHYRFQVEEPETQEMMDKIRVDLGDPSIPLPKYRSLIII
jgi:hypothetical protein